MFPITFDESEVLWFGGFELFKDFFDLIYNSKDEF